MGRKYEIRVTEDPAKHDPIRLPGEPTVGELMITDVFTLTEDDSLKALADIFELKMIRHIPIVSADGGLRGLITHRDFLKIAVSKLARLGKKETDELYAKIPIAEIMGRKVTTVTPETPLRRAAEIMLKHKYGCLPVVEGEMLVGIITESDFVAAFVRGALPLG